jgi:hypothetical protein
MRTLVRRAVAQFRLPTTRAGIDQPQAHTSMATDRLFIDGHSLLGGDSQVSKLTKNTVTPVWSYVDCLNDLATCMSPLRTSQTFSLISSEILRISRQARLCASSLNDFSCSMYSR